MPLSAHYHVLDTPISKTFQGHLKADKSGWTLINGVAVGSDVDERSGRNVVVKQLMMRWHVAPGWSTSTTPVYRPFRYMVCIIRDSQPQSDLPNWTEVFQNATIDSFLNIDNASRFKSIYRYVGHFGEARVEANSTTINSANYDMLSVPNFGEFVKNMNDKVRYDGDTATIGSLANGAYYVGMIVENKDGSDFAGTTVCPKLTAECRIRYQDL